MARLEPSGARGERVAGVVGGTAQRSSGDIRGRVDGASRWKDRRFHRVFLGNGLGAGERVPGKVGQVDSEAATVLLGLAPGSLVVLLGR